MSSNEDLSEEVEEKKTTEINTKELLKEQKKVLERNFSKKIQNF